MKINPKLSISILSIALFVSITAGILRGSANIPLRELFSEQFMPIVYIRVLRILLAIVAGFGLAASGVALQAVLRNPLAEPYLLGTSSGAGLGAVIAVILKCGQASMPIFAFVGAILTVGLVYVIARQGRKVPVQSLILSGVIISVAISGIMVFAISSSSDEALHGLSWWLWGSLEIYNIPLLLTVSAIVLIGVAVIYFYFRELNAISIGEEEAIHLGVDTEKVKQILLLTTSLITSSLVCVSGIIGFVGLVIPHIMRLLAGPNHKSLIPASCLGGAVFMIVCDTIGRTCISPSEIPIGVITAIVGAPIFIILLKRNRRVG